MKEVQTLSVAALPNVRVLGRHAGTDPLTLFYTASGIECRFTGSELWLELNADYGTTEPWLSVELNGAWIARFPVNRGPSRVCLFRGMTPGVPKQVRVLKDVQAMHDDPQHLLQITGLTFADGDFLPLPAPRYRLEFVGDSITSGEGAIGATCEQDWVGAFFSAENHYARLTADALGAEYRIVSQSGWGIVCGWDNNPACALPPYYTQVCGVAAGARNAALGAQQPNDFAAWQPDAVIVNLGTNDDGAFGNPPWTDPATGETFKLHQQPDGSPAPADAARVAAAMTDFLAVLRQNNPNALLVWAYGMLGARMMPVLQAGLARYRAQSGDPRAFLLPLPDTAPGAFGARQHPGLPAHRAAAETLTTFLRENLSRSHTTYPPIFEK